MPKGPLFSLLLSRLCEPLSMTVCFPFVNQMVQETGVDPAEVGYKAGLIESLFTFTQFVTILQWGRLSDKIGRKPVIMCGLAGVTVSSIAFGLSRTFVAMVITRCLAGALNGNVGVIKSALGELSDHTNEAQAFRWMPPAYTIGAALGPLVGGYLSSPAERYPSLFGYSAFLQEYKYFLPCFVGAMFPLSGMIFDYFCLQETLPSRMSGSDEEEADGTKTPVEIPSIRSVFTPRVKATLMNYAMLAATSITNLGVLPLFLYTPVRLGGIGFTTAQIGKALSGQAIATSCVQVFLFPVIHRRLGTVASYRLAVIFYPLGFLCYPLTRLAAAHRAGGDNTWVWISLAVQLGCLSLANMAYTANMLVINSSAPNRLALGTLNGVAQMLSSLVRSAGLAIGPSLFALSIQKNLLGGYAIYVYMFVTALILNVTSWTLITDAKATWRDEIVKVVDEDVD